MSDSNIMTSGYGTHVRGRSFTVILAKGMVVVEGKDMFILLTVIYREPNTAFRRELTKVKTAVSYIKKTRKSKAICDQLKMLRHLVWHTQIDNATF